MTCEERRDLMLLYATDGLEPAERAELRAHLATGCPACEGALAEAFATVAHLPLALNSIAPSAAARDKLLARVAADASQSSADSSSTGASAVSQPRRASGGGLLRIAMAACIGALIAGSIVWMTVRNQFNPVHTPDVQLVSLKGADAQPKARGRVFWDTDHNNWHVYVFDMAPPPPGKMYELWFVPSGKPPVPAGKIEVDSSGRGNLMVQVPKDIGPIALAAITDEPSGPLQLAPTGHFQLTGEVK